MAFTTRSQANLNQCKFEDFHNKNNRSVLEVPEGLATAATHFFEMFTNGHGMGTRSTESRCTFEKFSRQHPPIFDGKTNAIATEEDGEDL